MKRIFLAITAVALTSTTADAGPLRNLACAVRNRVQARPHIRQATCDFRTIANAVVTAPARIVEARPVRTAVVNAAQVFGSCPGGICK